MVNREYGGGIPLARRPVFLRITVVVTSASNNRLENLMLSSITLEACDVFRRGAESRTKVPVSFLHFGTPQSISMLTKLWDMECPTDGVSCRLLILHARAPCPHFHGDRSHRTMLIPCSRQPWLRYLESWVSGVGSAWFGVWLFLRFEHTRDEY